MAGDLKTTANFAATGAQDWPTPRSLPDIPGYEIRRELGRGGMGVVYEACDSKTKRLVALKTLPRLEPQALQRFKQEFRALADVTHPNVATLYELVSDGWTWFFGMELIDGVGFLDYVRCGSRPLSSASDETRQAPERLDRLRRALPQLCAGVSALHEAGVLHRDIKPSNVMVTPEERVVLLDFGLAAPLEQTGEYESAGLVVVGTPHYMSPEQAARLPVSTASDWYSVGVMLYEALTGRLPFVGTPLQIVIEKQRSDPRPPSVFVPGLPRDLDVLCMELLRRDPAARPGMAAILGKSPTSVARSEPSPSSTPSADLLVGRDGHLAVLRDCRAAMERGEAGTVFVHGHSGMGKTSLVQRFLEDARRRGATIISGRCYERESVPFKALDCLVDDLNRHLRRLPQAESAAVVPRDFQSLVRLFPVLGRVGSDLAVTRPMLEPRDEHEHRRRGIRALRELLARMGDRRSLVLFVDDLQWGDEDSAVLLADLLKPPDPPIMLFIGAYRAEDAESSPFLVKLRQLRAQGEHPWRQRELAVESLSLDDARDLTLALLSGRGDESSSQAELIASESAGSPFFIHELVRYLDLERGRKAPGGVNLDEVLWSRVRRLPQSARRLLEVVAVAGRPLLHAEAFQAAGVESEGPTLAATLRTSHFIRNTLTGDETVADTYHDRVREAVLAGMDRGALRGVHLAVAEVIEARLNASAPATVSSHAGGSPAAMPSVSLSFKPADWQRVFDLACHLDAAGQSGRAMPFALAAGERARAQYSLETAQQQLLIAERGSGEADRQTQFRVCRGLGEALMLAGHYEAAWPRLQKARSLAESDAARAEVEGRLGELAFKQGDLQTASESIERALRLLGEWTRHSGLVRLVWEGLFQVLHTLAPRWFLGRRSLENAQHDLLAIRLWSRQGYAYWFCRGPASGLANHIRSMNLAESYPPTAELAQVYSDHAAAMSVLPWFSRGVTYARKSVQFRRQAGDVWGLAQSLHFFGVMLYAASRYSESVDKCREAIRLFEQTGDYWEVNTARFNLAASLYRLGDLRAAAEEALRMHRSGLELGDAQAASLGLDILAKATRGRVSREALETELRRPRRGDALTASQVLQAEGVRRFYAGEYRDAAAAFEEAYEVARRAGVRNTYIVPAVPWMATALRCAAAEVAESAPAEARRLLRRARGAARRGLRLSRRFRNDLPHALRESALLAAARGSTGRARRLFEESLRVSETQGARYEHALTMQALGEAGRKLGWADAESWTASARQVLDALEASTPTAAAARRRLKL